MNPQLPEFRNAETRFTDFVEGLRELYEAVRANPTPVLDYGYEQMNPNEHFYATESGMIYAKNHIHYGMDIWTGPDLTRRRAVGRFGLLNLGIGADSFSYVICAPANRPQEDTLPVGPQSFSIPSEFATTSPEVNIAMTVMEDTLVARKRVQEIKLLNSWFELDSNQM